MPPLPWEMIMAGPRPAAPGGRVRVPAMTDVQVVSLRASWKYPLGVRLSKRIAPDRPSARFAAGVFSSAARASRPVQRTSTIKARIFTRGSLAKALTGARSYIVYNRIMRTRQRSAPLTSSTNRAPPEGGDGFFPSLAQHQTLEESAYQDLRRAIVEGRFAPGERIVAATVAAAAGISRIPVMQALRRLEADGFVRITPHKDVVVLGWARGEIRERFLLMAALEVLCLRES